MNLYLLYGLISGEKERDTDYKTVAVGEEWEEKIYYKTLSGIIIDTRIIDGTDKPLHKIDI